MAREQYLAKAHIIASSGASEYGFAQKVALDKGLQPGTPAFSSFVNAQVLKMGEEKSYTRGYASGMAHGNADMDKPMTPADAQYLRIPTTGAAVPLIDSDGKPMTMRRAVAQGARQVDKASVDKLAEMEKSKTVIGTLFGMADRLITAQTPRQALKQYAVLTAGAMSGSNVIARTYRDDRDAFLGSLARSVSEERGVLTDQDIKRIGAGFVTFGDTRPVLEAKKAVMSTIVQTQNDSVRARMFGEVRDEKAQRARLDVLLEKLDTLAKQTPKFDEAKTIKPDDITIQR